MFYSTPAVGSTGKDNPPKHFFFHLHYTYSVSSVLIAPTFDGPFLLACVEKTSQKPLSTEESDSEINLNVSCPKPRRCFWEHQQHCYCPPVKAIRLPEDCLGCSSTGSALHNTGQGQAIPKCFLNPMGSLHSFTLFNCLDFYCSRISNHSGP